MMIVHQQSRSAWMNVSKVMLFRGRGVVNKAWQFESRILFCNNSLTFFIKYS